MDHGNVMPGRERLRPAAVSRRDGTHLNPGNDPGRLHQRGGSDARGTKHTDSHGNDLLLSAATSNQQRTATPASLVPGMPGGPDAMRRREREDLC
jgi:hypothetical protein